MSTHSSDAILRHLDRNGHVEPGSRLLQLGLDQHNPEDALQDLESDPERLSVALHELTHLHSLDNLCGLTLGFLGHMASLYCDSVQTRMESGMKLKVEELKAYLYFRQWYVAVLGVWVPLLEGLAVFAQTSRPGRDLDALMSPINTLSFFEGQLSALSCPSVKAELPQRMIMAAYQAMDDGPEMPFGKQTLAEALECDTSKDWLPYFLGHAYIKGLQTQLAAKAPYYQHSEHFLSLMLRILRSSSREILGCDSWWDDPGSVDRLYGWIELFALVPAARANEIQKLPDTTDVLHYFRTGEVQSGYVSDTSELGAELEKVVPTPWQYFKRLTFFKARNVPDAASKIASAFAVATQTITLSSGGECSLVGWNPLAFAGQPGLLFQVAQKAWWLSLTPDEFKRPPFDLKSLPQVALGPMATSIPTQAERHALPLAIDSYYTYSPFGINSWMKSDLRFPIFLFEFHDTRTEHSVLTYAHPGPGRSVLRIAPAESTGILHRGTQIMRTSVNTALSVGLDALAQICATHLSQEEVDLVRKYQSEEQLLQSRQQQMWARRIIEGLLGENVTGRTINALLVDRMSRILPSQAGVRQVLSKSYGGWTRFDEKQPGQLSNVVRNINQAANQVIGKSIFQMRDDSTVQYTGLWG
jgi:hypothetical protein